MGPTSRVRPQRPENGGGDLVRTMPNTVTLATSAATHRR